MSNARHQQSLNRKRLQSVHGPASGLSKALLAWHKVTTAAVERRIKDQGSPACEMWPTHILTSTIGTTTHKRNQRNTRKVRKKTYNCPANSN